jgi:hypothetical protein
LLASDYVKITMVTLLVASLLLNRVADLLLPPFEITRLVF